jgi:hypothetical protein
MPPWSWRGRRPRKARLVLGARVPQRVDQLAAAVPTDVWQAFLIQEGSQGPLVAEFAFHRRVAVRAGMPGPDVWIVLRWTWGRLRNSRSISVMRQGTYQAARWSGSLARAGLSNRYCWVHLIYTLRGKAQAVLIIRIEL